MPNGNFIINLGELSRPATVLIEKISEAVGGYFKPWQIRRVAQAGADAERIKALAQIEISELQQRALRRFLAEEARKQDNMESITAKALPEVGDTSRPQDVQEDWIVNFFDKCRIVSDEEMQSLWAKILAGEANAPGTYSKRTVNFLASLDKADAILFTNLCSFAFVVAGQMLSVVLEPEDTIYTAHGITFVALKHLADIGLLSFMPIGGYEKRSLPKHITASYFGTSMSIEFKKEEDNRLRLGKVMLSQTGLELAPLCGADPVDGFVDYVTQEWSKKGVILSLPTRAEDVGASKNGIGTGPA